jgi:hypothetical protein
VSDAAFSEEPLLSSIELLEDAVVEVINGLTEDDSDHFGGCTDDDAGISSTD